MGALRNLLNKLPTERGRLGPIGLDLALEEAHLAQMVQQDGGRHRLIARATLRYPATREEVLHDPKALRMIVRELRRSSGARGRDVVVALPPDQVRIMSVTYERRTGQGDADAILQVMIDRLESPIEEYVIDFLPVGDQGGGVERLALVAVARRENVLSVLETLRRAGLRVAALEIGPTAIQRLVAATSDPLKPSNTLVLNFGVERSYLTMICGERLLFDQDIDFGAGRLLKKLADRLEMSPGQADEMVRRVGLGHAADKERTNETARAVDQILRPEFQRVISEVQRASMFTAAETHGGKLSKILIGGSIARWPGADRFIQHLVGVDVARLPQTALRLAGALDHPGSEEAEIAIAAGLALRGMKPHA